MVGLHGAHGDAYVEVLSQASQLCRLRSQCTRLLLLGDFNVDFLPSIANDPYSDVHLRSSRHSEGRDLVEALAESLHLAVLLPETFGSFPGVPWLDVACSGVAFTRIPYSGEDGQHCSLLDYFIGNPEEVSEVELWWNCAPADHALVSASIKAGGYEISSRKSRWSTQCWADARAGCKVSGVPAFHSYGEIRDYALAFQDEFADRRTCAERRTLFWSEAVKNLQTSVRLELNPGTRRALALQLRKAKAVEVQHHRSQQLYNRLKRGAAVTRKTALHTITGLLDDGSVITKSSDIASLVATEYGRKWCTHSPHAWSVVLDFVANFEGAIPLFTSVDLDAAFDVVQDRAKISSDGTSVAALQIIHLTDGDSNSTFFLDGIAAMLASTRAMSNITISARVCGKSKSQPNVADTRCIIPLPAPLQLADAMLAAKVAQIIDGYFDTSPLIFEGARKGTQTADVAAFLQIGIEKLLESNSVGAVFSTDIWKLFDCIPLLQVVQFLITIGLCSKVAAAVVRLHLVTNLELSCAGSSACLQYRTRGVLTGTRTANQLARVPMLEVLHNLIPNLREAGIVTGGERAVVATWIDNIFAVTRTAQCGVDLFVQIQLAFKTRWGLDFKPGSTELLLPEASSECFELPADWSLVTALRVLGHLISPCGGIRRSWLDCRRAMWISFWRNNGAKYVHSSVANSSLNLRLLNRVVRPLLSFRASCWPWQPSVAAEVDLTQTRMLAISAHCPKRLEESLETFFARRVRLAKKQATDSQVWSEHWRLRFCSFDSHLRRHPSHQASLLLKFRDEEWLQKRRAPYAIQRLTGSLRPFSMTAGRTNTRASRKVQPRWQESATRASRGAFGAPFSVHQQAVRALRNASSAVSKVAGF